jgi:hypothetical protein
MFKPVSLVYFTISLTAFCKLFSANRGVRWLVYMTHSSAYPTILVGYSIPLHMVAIATKKRVTLSTAPCTNPFSMLMGDDRVVPTVNLRVRLLINFLTNPSILPLSFHVFNVFNIPLLQQVSNILEIFSDSIAEYYFLRMASIMCVFNIYSTSVVDRFFLNSYCCSGGFFRLVHEPVFYLPFFP